jgi:hypothetical protein
VARAWQRRADHIDGFAYIFDRVETAVFVDARPPHDFRSDMIGCAVNMQLNEVDAANTDGRSIKAPASSYLPTTRIVPRKESVVRHFPKREA